MNVEELYDYMKTRNPSLNETSFLVVLNRILKKISKKAKNYTYSTTTSTVVGQREYELPSGVIAVYRVDYDGEEITEISESQVKDTDVS